MNFRATRILAAALLASSCGLAIGATKTTTFAVTATVVSNCFINSAGAMAFGNYTPASPTSTGPRPSSCAAATARPTASASTPATPLAARIAPRVMKSGTATRARWNTPCSPTPVAPSTGLTRRPLPRRQATRAVSARVWATRYPHGVRPASGFGDQPGGRAGNRLHQHGHGHDQLLIRGVPARGQAIPPGLLVFAPPVGLSTHDTACSGCGDVQS